MLCVTTRGDAPTEQTQTPIGLGFKCNLQMAVIGWKGGGAFRAGFVQTHPRLSDQPPTSHDTAQSKNIN